MEYYFFHHPVEPILHTLYKGIFAVWVTVGFSSAIGTYCAIHTIYSWNFTSSLNYYGNITDPDIHIPCPVLNLYVPLQSLVLNPNVPLPRPMLNPDVPLPSHVSEDASKKKKVRSSDWIDFWFLCFDRTICFYIVCIF